MGRRARKDHRQAVGGLVFLASLSLVSCGSADAPASNDVDASARGEEGGASLSGYIDPDAGSGHYGRLVLTPLGTQPSSLAPRTVPINLATARFRTRPDGSGVLSVSLEDTPRSGPSVSFELTLYDDLAPLASAEAFPAVAPRAQVSRGARLEAFHGNGPSWHSNGEGEVVVERVTDRDVTLTFKNVGQVAGAAEDCFVVNGMLTVGWSGPTAWSGGNVSLSQSHARPQQWSGEPLNAAAPETPFDASDVRHGEAAYPRLGLLRSIVASDPRGESPRHLRVAFPSGHLPHRGQSLSLASQERVQVFYFEGASELAGKMDQKVWVAERGVLVVQATGFTGITLELQNARMQPYSPAAKGSFEWNGSVVAVLAPSPP